MDVQYNTITWVYEQTDKRMNAGKNSLNSFCNVHILYTVLKKEGNTGNMLNKYNRFVT